MSNKFITPEQFAKDVLDTIHRVEKEEGFKKDELLKAWIKEWEKNWDKQRKTLRK